MKDNKNITSLRPSIWFRLFRAYLRFIHNRIYFRHVTYVGLDNIPENGTPLIIACNHQNCMNDPLHILFSLKRKASFLTRADIFAKPLLNKFLRSIGLLPAYRMNFDGEDALANNAATWQITGDELLRGRTVVIFPEAGHQDMHWLGDFSLGYIRLAFETAERDNFETDIQILPACNHYSNYFHMRTDVVIKYGTPISLKQFYDTYKTKPRTAQREANKLVRNQIESLMLDIKDLPNYDAIDYIRNTYGKHFAEQNGANSKHLDEKLVTDKQLVDRLDAYSATNPQKAALLYNDTIKLKDETLALGVRDWNFEKPFSTFQTIVYAFGALLLLPLFTFALVPNLAIYLFPKLITRKLKDKLFTSSVNFGLSAVVSIPILYTAMFFIDWYLLNSTVLALIHIMLLPLLGLFAWQYMITFIKSISKLRFKKFKKSGKIHEIAALRTSLWKRLDLIVK